MGKMLITNLFKTLNAVAVQLDEEVETVQVHQHNNDRVYKTTTEEAVEFMVEDGDSAYVVEVFEVERVDGQDKKHKKHGKKHHKKQHGKHSENPAKDQVDEWFF